VALHEKEEKPNAETRRTLRKRREEKAKSIGRAAQFWVNRSGCATMRIGIRGGQAKA
jgi:hypothetical protein